MLTNSEQRSKKLLCVLSQIKTGEGGGCCVKNFTKIREKEEGSVDGQKIRIKQRRLKEGKNGIW